MNELEQEISFLNRYFIYKKVREVNVDELNISLSEYDESLLQREKEQEGETKEENKKTFKEKVKLKSKVKKLSKKILLVPATEAVEEHQIEEIEKAIGAMWELIRK